MTELLTTEQAARRLDISAGTLTVWRSVKRYKLSYIKIGRKVRYTPESIDKFLNERTQSGVGQEDSTPGRGRRAR